MSPIPTARPEVLAILAALIEERVGLHYRSDSLELVKDRLVTRALEAGFDSLLDYYYFLRYDSESKREFDALVEEIVVGETYFFRELDQLSAVVEHLVRPAVEARGRARIWSAACATGEEPLTIAMLLSEADLFDRVEIFASDISERSLRKAQSGRYGPRSVRERRPEWAFRYLTPHDGGHRVAKELCERIRWQRLNLIDPEQLRSAGHFDVILCKNVLIYFNDVVVRRLVESLADQLTPDGALVLGVSESLLRLGTSLRCQEIQGVFFYRKAKP
jgi:chemotaxis protein methyltransferase CheR